MKKAISVILAVVFVFTAVTAMTLTSSATDIKVVYLDSTNGNDSSSGLTTGKAVATLYAAFTKLGNDGGIIDVIGNTIMDDPALTEDMQTAAGYQLDMPAHTGKVYITSHNGSKLIKNESSTGTVISFFGPVEIYNITIENTQAQNINLYTYCNEFTVGMGVDVIADSQTHCLRIYGFTANSDSGIEGNPVINIYSGNFGKIYGAGTAGAGQVKGNPIINLYGGVFDSVYEGGAGGVDGNTTINVYKGVEIQSKIGLSGETTGTKTANYYNFTLSEESAITCELTINSGLTGVIPTTDSSIISFSIETDDPNETTVVPETTETPVTTEVPITTKAPTTTKIPTTTATPATTNSPAATTKPVAEESGCGKSEGGIILAVVQAALIIGSAVSFTAIKKH